MPSTLIPASITIHRVTPDQLQGSPHIWDNLITRIYL